MNKVSKALRVVRKTSWSSRAKVTGPAGEGSSRVVFILHFCGLGFSQHEIQSSACLLSLYFLWIKRTIFSISACEQINPPLFLRRISTFSKHGSTIILTMWNSPQNNIYQWIFSLVVDVTIYYYLWPVGRVKLYMFNMYIHARCWVEGRDTLSGLNLLISYIRKTCDSCYYFYTYSLVSELYKGVNYILYA